MLAAITCDIAPVPLVSSILQVNTAAGLRGTTAVMVTGAYASLDAEKRLVSALLDTLTAAR